MMRFASSHPRRTFNQGPGRENAKPHRDYAIVKAILANRTDNAVLLSREDLVQAVWVPRAALDTGGKITVSRAVLKTEIEIGIELEMAQSKGLV